MNISDFSCHYAHLWGRMPRDGSFCHSLLPSYLPASYNLHYHPIVQGPIFFFLFATFYIQILFKFLIKISSLSASYDFTFLLQLEKICSSLRSLTIYRILTLIVPTTNGIIFLTATIIL